MNIITLLQKDHQKVTHELAKLLEVAVEKRVNRLEELTKALKTHEKVEETIFYPKLKNNPKTKDMILEAFEEHHVIDVLLDELRQLQPTEEQWAAKCKVLQENLAHHIHEEEDHLFPKVSHILKEDDLEELGKEMQKFAKKE